MFGSIVGWVLKLVPESERQQTPTARGASVATPG